MAGSLHRLTGDCRKMEASTRLRMAGPCCFWGENSERTGALPKQTKSRRKAACLWKTLWIVFLHLKLCTVICPLAKTVALLVRHITSYLSMVKRVRVGSKWEPGGPCVPEWCTRVFPQMKVTIVLPRQRKAGKSFTSGSLRRCAGRRGRLPGECRPCRCVSCAFCLLFVFPAACVCD